MSSIDERVVEAKFDNRQFQAGVKDTLSSLDSLKKGMQFEGTTSGLSNLSGNIDKIAGKFSAMGIAGVTAIANITTKAVDAGIRIAKSLTIDPIKEGLQSYNDQINATQVIIANTKAQGTTLKQVTASLADLQTYANLTVYSFSDMTQNIGRFTAAGVALEPATQAIKGMANVAALSGANTQQMGSAMYQMSQALSTGVIRLQDWNSLSNANMAGTNVQKALEATAHSMGSAGKKMDEAIKSQGNFRNSLQKGWLTSGIFTKTMKIMAGTIDQSTGKMKAFTVEQIRHMGYTAKDAKALQALSQSALDSAIKIRTLPQMMQALKEEVATAYSSVFKTIFGDINQATDLFTALHTTIENALTGPIYAFNHLLQGWAKMGGRFVLLDGLKLAMQALGDVWKTLKSAFREIFPPTTAKDLYNLTVQFHVFAENLKPLPATIDKLKRIFAGLFAVVDIVWQAIKAGSKFLFELLGTVGHTSKGLLDFAARIGDMLVALDQALKKGDGFTKFFEALRKVLTPVISVLGLTRIKMLDLANGVTTGVSIAGSVLGTIPKIFSAISAKVHDVFSNMFGGLNFEHVLQMFNAGLFAGLLLLLRKFVRHITREKTSALQGFVDKITEPLHQLTATLKEMQQAIMAATILEIAIAVGILAASVIALSFVDPKRLASSLGAITVMFSQLVGALYLFKLVGGAKGLTTTSAGLILFATALRVLASSVIALAKLSWQELAKGLSAVTILIGGLVLATAGMAGNTAGMVRAGAGLLILAVGIKVLASAVGDFAKLNWTEIAKGLAGVAGTLLALTLFTKFADADKGGIAQGAGLLLLATGIRVLANAAQIFAKISWQGLAKGFAALSGTLLAVAIFSRTTGNPASLLASSAALIGVGVAMNILAGAMKIFASMSWGDTARGLVAMAGALIIISAALDSMPITSVLSAVALMGVSVALVAIGGAMKVMGSMSWTDIAQSLVLLAGALTIISVAMDAMLLALPGAAALLVVAAALAILVPELVILGAQSWENIAKGLVGLAGAFTVFGVAAIVLSEALPLMFGLAGSIALLGVGLALVGGAVYLFATGLQILSLAGAGAAAAIKLLVESIVGLLPTIVKALGVMLVSLAQAVATAAPQLLHTAIILIDGLLTAINREGPKIIKTFFNLVGTLLDQLSKNAAKFTSQMVHIVVSMLNVLANNAGQFVTAGVRLVVNLLNGLASHMNQLVTAGVNVIIAFIRGVGSNAVRLANAAMDTIVQFINGVANAIETHRGALQDAGKHLAFAIADGMTMGLASKVGDVAKATVGLAKSGWDAATGWLHSHSPSKRYMQLGQWIGQGLAIGIVGSRQQVIDAWNKTRDLLKASIDGSKQDISTYTDKLKAAQKAHNTSHIKQYTAALAEAHKEYTNSTAALNYMNTHLKKQEDRLYALGRQYETYTAQLDAANQKLADAKQLRDDYNKSTTDQYNTLPDIANDTQLSDYETSLKKTVVDTQSFADVMAQLRKMGLDDKTYQDLIGKGPDMLPFAEQILAGGQDAIKELDSLDSKLASEATAMGSAASTALYQAGVNAAQGLVDGLNKQRNAILKTMNGIADSMVAQIKKQLKIKSPSHVFDELGQFTGKGLANGLKKSVPHVQRATQHLGKNTIESMKESIRMMNDLMSEHIDMNPSIKPILDLSAVRRQAIGMAGMLASKGITTDAVYAKAMNVSAGYEANAGATAPGDTSENAPGSLTYVQNNYSPKALSSADIYRQTNNQLSRAKGALNPGAVTIP